MFICRRSDQLVKQEWVLEYALDRFDEQRLEVPGLGFRPGGMKERERETDTQCIVLALIIRVENNYFDDLRMLLSIKKSELLHSSGNEALIFRKNVFRPKYASFPDVHI